MKNGNGRGASDAQVHWMHLLPDVNDYVRKCVVFCFGTILNALIYWKIDPDELTQEGVISFWQRHEGFFAKGYHRGHQGDGVGLARHYLNYLRMWAKYDILHYIRAAYESRVEDPLSVAMPRNWEGTQEEWLELVGVAELRNEAAEIFDLLEEKIESTLREVTIPAHRSKIPYWMRVLQLSSRGYTNCEIAEELGIGSDNRDRIWKTKAMLAERLLNSPEFCEFLLTKIPGLELKKLFQSQKYAESIKWHSGKFFGAIPSETFANRRRPSNGGNSWQRVEADFASMPTKDIVAKYGVSRSAAWKARKRGWLVIGKKKQNFKSVDLGSQPEHPEHVS